MENRNNAKGFFGKAIGPDELFVKFKERFKKMSNDELVEAFNREVGKAGWTGARGAYLAALHREFEDRGIEICRIGDESSLSLAKKVKIEVKPVLVPVGE